MQHHAIHDTCIEMALTSEKFSIVGKVFQPERCKSRDSTIRKLMFLTVISYTVYILLTTKYFSLFKESVITTSK